ILDVAGTHKLALAGHALDKLAENARLRRVVGGITIAPVIMPLLPEQMHEKLADKEEPARLGGDAFVATRLGGDGRRAIIGRAVQHRPGPPAANMQWPFRRRDSSPPRTAVNK